MKGLLLSGIGMLIFCLWNINSRAVESDVKDSLLCNPVTKTDKLNTVYAVLKGEVMIPESKFTSVLFEYGKTKKYGNSLHVLPEYGKQGKADISVGVTGLEPGTIYHYRLIVVNETRICYGDDQTFTTLPLSPVVMPAKKELSSNLAGNEKFNYNEPVNTTSDSFNSGNKTDFSLNNSVKNPFFKTSPEIKISVNENEVFVIFSQGRKTGSQIRLLSLSGKVMFTDNVNCEQCQFSLAGISSGYYIVNVVAGSQVKSAMIFIN